MDSSILQDRSTITSRHASVPVGIRRGSDAAPEEDHTGTPPLKFGNLTIMKNSVAVGGDKGPTMLDRASHGGEGSIVL